MVKPELDRVPTLSALRAFECAARHGSFSRAAKELDISQPAISRQIAYLEKLLTTRLFDRSPEGVTLTDAGSQFRDAVTAGLSIIHEAAVDTASLPHGDQLVIGCSHDVAHFFLLPRYQALQHALGHQVAIRVLTYHHTTRQLPLYPVPDVTLDWEASIDTDDYVVIHQEAAGPVCSPAFASAHRETLREPVTNWGSLTFLDLSRPNLGWATWDDWFHVVGRPRPAPRCKFFDSYGYVLQAAADGLGVALGWRHFAESFLETGALVRLGRGVVNFDNRFCGAPTARGRNKPLAQMCLEFLGDTENQARAEISDPVRLRQPPDRQRSSPA